MTASIQIALGLVCLAVGGDILVRGAVGIAERLKVSALVTGLVLVGFGTSTPELATSVNAVFKNSPEIAVGNVVGSNIANILLILGIAALITPLAIERKALKRDGPAMGIAALACLLISQIGTFDRYAGAILVAALVAYVGYTYRVERRHFDAQAALHAGEPGLAEPHARTLSLSGLFVVAGIGLVILGANLMVDGSLTVARALGISELVIGLTVVAVGTSLPELATSIIAALRRQADIAIGNIVGSNIFNILGILGVSALLKPFDPPAALVAFDLWIMLAATVLLLVFAWFRGQVNRPAGLLFLFLYGAYILFLATR